MHNISLKLFVHGKPNIVGAGQVGSMWGPMVVQNWSHALLFASRSWRRQNTQSRSRFQTILYGRGEFSLPKSSVYWWESVLTWNPKDQPTQNLLRTTNREKVWDLEEQLLLVCEGDCGVCGGQHKNSRQRQLNSPIKCLPRENLWICTGYWEKEERDRNKHHSTRNYSNIPIDSTSKSSIEIPQSSLGWYLCTGKQVLQSSWRAYRKEVANNCWRAHKVRKGRVS